MKPCPICHHDSHFGYCNTGACLCVQMPRGRHPVDTIFAKHRAEMISIYDNFTKYHLDRKPRTVYETRLLLCNDIAFLAHVDLEPE